MTTHGLRHRTGRAMAALGIATALAGGFACTAAPPSSETAPAPIPFDRTKPPTLPRSAELRLPPVTKRQLPNGLTLLIVEHHELPIADFILFVGSGVEADPAATAGLATLTASMLLEGTTTRSALALADQQAFLGIALGAASSWDGSIVNLHTPTAQLDSALALFADVVLHPAFPPAELERLRRDRLTTHLQLRDRPAAIADLASNAILFGDHPYGRSTIGTEASTRAIARDDIASFYRMHYRPNNATLIVVGAVRANEIERRARALFGTWERGPVATPVAPAAPAARATTVHLIDKPGAPQSSIRITTVGAPRSSADYFGITVMNTILGGAFTSRLNQNLRETHGYTYGAGSQFQMRRAAGPFVASAEVTGTKTDSSLIQFMNELRGIRDTVSAAELERAKQLLMLQLPRQFETTTDIANQLVPLVRYGLPLDYYDSYANRIAAITQADVQRVAHKYLALDRLAIVVVGDRASIEPGIRALRLGEVSIRDLTGHPVRP